MAIQVTIEDHTGNIRHQAKLSETAAVEQLIRAIITALKMPVTDSTGRPITYYLAHNGRRLQESDTLTSAEVRSNDTISIVPIINSLEGRLSEQIGDAIAREDWRDVIRKVDLLLKLVPTSLSSEIYYIQSQAFLAEGDKAHASESLYNALALATESSQRLDLLEEYHYLCSFPKGSKS
jgi:hypothetical protein